MDRRTILVLLFTATAGASLSAGCASAPPKSRLASQVTSDTGKIQGLRYKVLGFVGLFSATVEDTADVIAARTTEPVVRKNALLWKMNAIPAALTASVHPDPLATLVDAWALSAQMEQYFSAGAGTALFGAQQRLSVDASRELTAAAAAILRAFMPADMFDKAITNGGQWVAAHPLKTPLFARDSAVELVASLMANQGGSIFGAMGSLEDRMDGLTARITVYGAVTPKLLRWQAELMLLDVPVTLVQVQERVIQAVRDERKAVTDAIDQQRLQAFDQIRAERIAFTQDLEAAVARFIRDATSVVEPVVDRERAATLTVIDDMRIRSVKDVRDFLVSVNQRWLDTLDYSRGERVAAMRDAEQIAVKTVDRAFQQLYQLLAVLYLATLAGAALLVFLWKKLALRRA